MKILIATHNPGKLKEFRLILEPQGYEVLTLKESGASLDGFEETGATFEENARLKAKFIHDQLGVDVIADDSGLIIHSLPDILGVKTARFMGEDTDYKLKHERILKMLENKNREATFFAVIAYYGKNVDEVFEGRCEGQIATSIQGSDGFGYDPIFIPMGYQDTFSILGADVKNTVSHRAKALVKLTEFINEK